MYMHVHVYRRIGGSTVIMLTEIETSLKLQQTTCRKPWVCNTFYWDFRSLFFGKSIPGMLITNYRWFLKQMQGRNYQPTIPGLPGW